jgi:hypothetical protein
MFLGRRIFRLCWPIGERQQLVDLAHRVAGNDLGEHLAQIGLRIDVIHLASLNERSEDRPVFSAVIRSGEQMILSAQCNRSHRALDDVGIDFDATIVEKA